MGRNALNFYGPGEFEQKLVSRESLKWAYAGSKWDATLGEFEQNLCISQKSRINLRQLNEF